MVKQLLRWWIALHARSLYRCWGYQHAVPIVRATTDDATRATRWYWRRVLRDVEVIRAREKTDCIARFFGVRPDQVFTQLRRPPAR